MAKESMKAREVKRDTEMPEEYIADAGILQVKMPAYGAMVLHHRARDKYK